MNDDLIASLNLNPGNATSGGAKKMGKSPNMKDKTPSNKIGNNSNTSSGGGAVNFKIKKTTSQKSSGTPTTNSKTSSSSKKNI